MHMLYSRGQLRYATLSNAAMRWLLTIALLETACSVAAAPLRLPMCVVLVSPASRPTLGDAVPLHSIIFDVQVHQSSASPIQIYEEMLMQRDCANCPMRDLGEGYRTPMFYKGILRRRPRAIPCSCQRGQESAPKYETDNEKAARGADVVTNLPAVIPTSTRLMYLPRFFYHWACNSNDDAVLQSLACVKTARLWVIGFTVGGVLFAIAALFMIVCIHKWRRRNKSYRFSLASPGFRPMTQRTSCTPSYNTERSERRTVPKTGGQDVDGGVPCGLDGVQDGWTAWILNKRGERVPYLRRSLAIIKTVSPKLTKRLDLHNTAYLTRHIGSHSTSSFPSTSHPNACYSPSSCSTGS